MAGSTSLWTDEVGTIIALSRHYNALRMCLEIANKYV